jgi:NTE family protein
MSTKEIRDFFLAINWQTLADFEIPEEGMIKGDRMERYLSSKICYKKFEDLRIPLSVVAADLETGDEVILNKGDVARAVHASAALPVILSPVKYKGMTLVDGGIVNPVPADIVKKMGADIVIAVDTSIKPSKVRFTEIGKRKKFMNKLQMEYFGILHHLIDKRYFLKTSSMMRRFFRPIFRVFFQPNMIARFISNKELPAILKMVDTSNLIMIDKLAEEKLKREYVDIIIKPNVEMYYIEFDKIDYCIRRGKLATMKMIPQLKKLISKRSK